MVESGSDTLKMDNLKKESISESMDGPTLIEEQLI